MVEGSRSNSGALIYISVSDAPTFLFSFSGNRTNKTEIPPGIELHHLRIASSALRILTFAIPVRPVTPTLIQVIGA